MSRRLYLTDKQMANRRFRKTEEAIINTFFRNNAYISSTAMAKKVGISRTTIYHHHRAVRDIVPDYKNYVMRQYRSFLSKRLKDKKVSLNSIYLDMLIFILRNKKFIKFLLKNNDKELLERIVSSSKDRAMAAMRMTKSHEKLYNVYVGEIVSILNEWVRDGFDEKQIDSILGNIAYLTNTAKIRLAGIK